MHSHAEEERPCIENRREESGWSVLAASDLLVAHFRIDTRGSELFLPFIVMGIGMGLSMTPLTNLTLYGVAPEKSGGASGVLSTMRQIGAVMGVAIFSVALQANMVGAMKIHAAEVPHLPPAAQAVLVSYVSSGGLYGMSDDGPNGLAAQLAKSMRPPAATGTAMRQPSAAELAAAGQQMKEMGAGVELSMKRSFTDGINDTFRLAALIGVGAVIVAFFMAGSRRKKLAVEARSATASQQSGQLAADSDEGMAAGE